MKMPPHLSFGTRPRRVTAIAMLLALTGCDAKLDKLFDLLSGATTNTVVLSKNSARLNTSPTKFLPTEPMFVAGSQASVCVVLAGGIPLQSTSTMDAVFNKLMQDAILESVLRMEDGSTVTFSNVGRAWSMWGNVVERDEVAACSSAKCGTELPIGAKFKAVEITASPALEIKGVYWSSTNAFDKHQPTKPSESTAKQNQKPAGNSHTSC